MNDRKPMGFAAMDPETQRAIAARGGRAAQASGRAPAFTKETGAAAGRKGGAIASRDRAHMAEIGRKGGTAKRRRSTPLSPEPTADERVALDVSTGSTFDGGGPQ